MMRRIDLMPASYAERRKQRRAVGLVAVAGLVLLVALLAWWVVLGTQISGERERLAEVQARNAELQASIDELARFAELEREVQQRQIALQTAMAGDVDWPALLTEVAMVVPALTKAELRELNVERGVGDADISLAALAKAWDVVLCR